MNRIVTVDEMRHLEAEADALGVSYAEMMQRAGTAVAQTALAYAGDLRDEQVLVLVGPGNNGGDGLVAGVQLADAGAQVKCYFLKSPDETNPQVQAARKAGLFIVDAENDHQSRALTHLLGGSRLVIDALLGTGASLPLRNDLARLLRRVQARLEQPDPPLVLAVDVPTGMDCDTGAVDPAILPADITVTFGAAKVGQFAFPAADFLGEVVLAELGWPDDMDALAEIQLGLADDELAADLLPERPRNAHKGTFGKALVVAGSGHYVGAAFLAGAAAYRAGAGLVTLATTPAVQAALAGHLPEVTWLPQGEDDGWLSADEAGALVTALPDYQALLFGSGWGTRRSTAGLLSALLNAGGGLPPTVVDADGLRLLAEVENWPARLPDESVLTPHPGEMAALTGLPVEEIQAARVATARRFAAEWGHVVALKGAFSVVAAPDGRAVILPFATPALARAGSGDVLAGLICGLRAQGLDGYDAAVLGGYLHGTAGLLAAEVLDTTASVLASDVLSQVPVAISRLEGEKHMGDDDWLFDDDLDDDWDDDDD